MLKNLAPKLKISGISADSRTVKKGEIYVAIKGLTHDGHNYIPDIVKKGIKVIVGEKDLKLPANITYLQVKDSKQALGELASEFYGHPSKKLTVIGVTGTKGKTTTCHLIHHLLTAQGKKAGLISSITSPGFHVTTPDPVSLHQSLKEMVEAGCKYAVIEVSSHGIDQKRIAGVKFSVGILTNIAPEHLDYHKTLVKYRRTKLSFLKSAKIRIIAQKETKLNILPGKFNNLNAQAAVDTVAALGFAKNKVVGALQSFKLPEGRLEKIENNRGFEVYIDFAHTPDSLKNVLTYLRGITKGRLIAVFGCAGERDRSKRFVMGKISASIADVSVITAEDPRSEKVFDILGQMKGYAKNFVVIPERGEAIAYALSVAERGDLVVITGKGHEKSMAYGGYEHPWSDQETVRNYLDKKEDVAAVVLAAGMGTRMKSFTPKVLLEICGRPMISYTLENLRKSKIGEIVVVVSYGKSELIKTIGGAVKFAYQKNPKGGTADAAAAGLKEVSSKVKILVVVNGDDSAFYKPGTINNVIVSHKKTNSVLTFVSLERDSPYGLGRVVRDKTGKLMGIVEEKDANLAQRKIKEVNIGLYVFDKSWFEKNIDKVELNPRGEYYLVDLVKMAVDKKEKVSVYHLEDGGEWQGKLFRSSLESKDWGN